MQDDVGEELERRAQIRRHHLHLDAEEIRRHVGGERGAEELERAVDLFAGARAGATAQGGSR